jgi:hypothetical protein
MPHSSIHNVMEVGNLPWLRPILLLWKNYSCQLDKRGCHKRKNMNFRGGKIPVALMVHRQLKD